MTEPRDPPSDPERSEEHGPDLVPDLVPDVIEDAAHGVAGSVRDVGGRASRSAKTVVTVTGKVTGQATGQIIELTTAARQDDVRHWRALAACVIAVVASAINPPVLQATSSGIQGALHVDPEGAAELVGLYYVIQAGTMVLGGVLGDRFGTRRVLTIGLIGLFGAALLMALGPSWLAIIVGSVGLSLFSAFVFPLSLAGVLRTFDQRVLPVGIALFLSIQLTATLITPALSQWLFDAFGFSATMVPTLVMASLALVAVRRWLPETRAAALISRVDALAILLWAFGVLAIVYGAVAFAGGWGNAHLLAIILGAVFLAAALARFARGSSRVHIPNVSFRIIGLALFLGATLGLVQSGALLQLSNFLKGVQGYSPVGSGIALAPFALGTLFAALATGVALTRRIRGTQIELRIFRRPVVLGFAMMSASMVIMGFLREDTSYLVIGIALGLLGVGAGIANVPRTSLLFQSVRGDRFGVAAGLNGSAFLLGSALGSVAVTAMIAITTAAAWQQQLVDAGMTSAQAAETYQAAQRAIFLATAHPYLQPSYLDVVKQIPGWSEVFTAGFTSTMLAFAVMAAIATVVAFIGLRDPRTAPSLAEPAAPETVAAEPAAAS